jgi:NADH-quinone oxidoreductase subunit D
MTDPLQVPYRERERSVTMEPVSGTAAVPEGEQHDELFTINIGPHHPATHGVLRLLTTLEGEIVRDVKPIIGYVHTGIEKSCEDQQYWKAITFVERMDYLAYYYNAMAFCMAVERLLEEEVPPRAQYLRVLHLELNRIASHLFWIATAALDIGAVTMLWWGCRDRDLVLDLFEMSSGQRIHTRYFQVGGVIEDIPPGWEAKVREFLKIMPKRLDQYLNLLDRNEIRQPRLKGKGIMSQ